MNTITTIATMTIPERARAVLDWVATNRARYAARAVRPLPPALAFTGSSALALASSDCERLAAQPAVLMRTHTLAYTLCFEQPAPMCLVDAADFDRSQRDSASPWDRAPKPQDGFEVAGSQLRNHALRNASLVTVVDDGFTSGGPEYTVAALTPGWVAVLAMARVGEAEAAIATGHIPPTARDARTADALATLMIALKLDRGGVGATMERIRSSETRAGRGLQWSGAAGADALLERFFSSVENNPAILHRVNTERMHAGQSRYQLATMLDCVEYAATSLGFEPILGRGLDAR